MIHPGNEIQLKEILDIEKMVFTQLWSSIQFKSELTLITNTENWVFQENQQVVGYIFGWKVMDQFHLNNIAIHTDFQRKNIGWSLIEYLSVSLQNQSIQRIYLEVSENNKPAQQLYNSLGFQQNGMRKDYYAKRDHALLYHLDLITND